MEYFSLLCFILLAVLLGGCGGGNQALSRAPARVISVAIQPANYGILDTTHRSATVRFHYQVTCACHGLQLTVGNWYRNNAANNAESPNPTPITFKAALEVAQKYYPVTFKAQRMVTLLGGVHLASDPLAVNIAAGTEVYARIYYTLPVGGGAPVYAYEGSEDCAAWDTDLCDAVGVTGLTQQCSFRAWGATALLGMPTDVKTACVALVGDSIMAGSDDNAGDDYEYGFVKRALGARIPSVNISCGGESAAAFLTCSQQREQLLNYATCAVCNYGTNDLGAGESLPTIENNLLAVWRLLHDHHLTVYHCTILPRSVRSADNWSSLANQVVDAASEPTRVALNDWLRDPSSHGAVAQSGGALTGIFETADTVESARNSGLWSTAVQFDAGGPGAQIIGGANFLQDTSKNWRSHTLDYMTVLNITGGTGAGQSEQIVANSPANTLITAANWATIPDATSSYALVYPYTWDGIHPAPFGHAAMARAIDITRFTN